MAIFRKVHFDSCLLSAHRGQGTEQVCFSRSFPDTQPHPGAVGSCRLCAGAVKPPKPGSQAEAVEGRGPEPGGETVLQGDLSLDQPRG